MWKRAAPYLVAVLSVLVATAIAVRLYPIANDFAALLLLAAVAISASIGGYGPAFVATVCGFLALDFFFESPPFPLEGTRPGTPLGLVAVLIVAVLLRTLNARFRAAGEPARARTREAE